MHFDSSQMGNSQINTAEEAKTLEPNLSMLNMPWRENTGTEQKKKHFSGPEQTSECE